jgi:serine/threonine protein kinase
MRFNPKHMNDPDTSQSAQFSTDALKFLAAGKSSVVYGIDDKRIVKVYTSTDDNEDVIERRAYERLGFHRNIVKCFGYKDGSIVLERGQVLRGICRQRDSAHISFQRKLRWLIDFAEGLRYIHGKSIVHADVGCHNAVLTQHDCLKIIDFEGCSMDGGEASSSYEWFSYRPSTPKISKQTDIFAYGCAVFEVLTGRTPYDKFETSNHRTELVERLYQENRFPDVTNLPLSKLMRGCWYGTINSMEEVLKELEAAKPSLLDEAVQVFPQDNSSCSRQD